MPTKNLEETHHLCKINVPVSNKLRWRGRVQESNCKEKLVNNLLGRIIDFFLTNISIFRKNKLLVKYEYFLSGTSTPPRMILDSIKKIKFSMDLCKLQASKYTCTFNDDTTVSV